MNLELNSPDNETVNFKTTKHLQFTVVCHAQVRIGILLNINIIDLIQQCPKKFVYIFQSSSLYDCSK